MDQEVAALEAAHEEEASVEDHMVVLEDQDPVVSVTAPITDHIIIIITDQCFGDLVVLTDLDTDTAAVALADCSVC